MKSLYRPAENLEADLLLYAAAKSCSKAGTDAGSHPSLGPNSDPGARFRHVVDRRRLLRV